jgi:hypothetical protein
MHSQLVGCARRLRLLLEGGSYGSCQPAQLRVAGKAAGIRGLSSTTMYSMGP